MVTCTFCDLIESGDARWVASAEDAVAFFPLAEGRLAPGHTLVVPRAHHVGVLNTPPALLAATITLVQRVGLAMQRALDADGVVVLNASGPSSGQSVFHLHFHVIPRWREPDGTTLWPAERSTRHISEEVLDRIAEAMR